MSSKIYGMTMKNSIYVGETARSQENNMLAVCRRRCCGLRKRFKAQLNCIAILLNIVCSVLLFQCYRLCFSLNFVVLTISEKIDFSLLVLLATI